MDDPKVVLSIYGAEYDPAADLKATDMDYIMFHSNAYMITICENASIEIAIKETVAFFKKHKSTFDQIYENSYMYNGSGFTLEFKDFDIKEEPIIPSEFLKVLSEHFITLSMHSCNFPS